MMSYFSGRGWEGGRIRLTLAGPLAALAFGRLLSGSAMCDVPLIAALDWLLISLLNRVSDTVEDAVNGVPGTAFFSRHARRLNGIAGLLLVASFVATHAANPTLTPLRALFHLTGLSYNRPLVGMTRRLKQIPLVKNVVSSALFLLPAIGYPMATIWCGRGHGALAVGILRPTVWALAAFLFLFQIGIEILHDLGDRPGDAAGSVRTLPVERGRETSRLLFEILLFAAAGVLLLGYLADVVPPRVLVLTALPAAALTVEAGGRRRDLLRADALRAGGLTSALLLAYSLWLLLDLPGSHP
jgi:4-hydroxybenzoate polyprenyltransferase